MVRQGRAWATGKFLIGNKAKGWNVCKIAIELGGLEVENMGNYAGKNAHESLYMRSAGGLFTLFSGHGDVRGNHRQWRHSGRQHKHPGPALHCLSAQCGSLLELETKVHPKVRNHGEGPY